MIALPEFNFWKIINIHDEKEWTNYRTLGNTEFNRQAV
jgi:hypothetical protein